ncbi:MAG: alpha/beta fold hydrolase [Myxococcales bacterium]|nr:alpha/beta fold hydrolase [Myxococcales bacterium]
MTAAYEPIREGDLSREGVNIHYRVFGTGEVTLLFAPPWIVAHSAVYRAQIAGLAHRFRIITLDGRGNGLSGRPKHPSAYRHQEYVDDSLAVADACDAEQFFVAGASMAAHRAALLAAQHPERVQGLVAISPGLPVGPQPKWKSPENFVAQRRSYERFERFNLHHWKQDYEGFARYFVGLAHPEPHTSRMEELGIEWALETDAETLILSSIGAEQGNEGVDAAYRSIRCPVLVMHGDQDEITPIEAGRYLADASGGEFVRFEGAGHCTFARHPVRVNRLIEQFVDRVLAKQSGVTQPNPTRRPRPTTTNRRKRALYLSSPIGLGHAMRDLAIARELRALEPTLQIDWLAQDPVTRVLEAAGERVHPASARLASESAHLVDQADEHSLQVFQALRTMDTLLLRNFTAFQRALEEGDYDLVLCDEAWDVDHFWHEHPELKRGAYVWMTDFVGSLPMPSGGPEEAALVEDLNTEMITRVERRDLRDRAIFVGNPEDIIEARFGGSLPSIREWTEAHFDFSGYITGFDPASLGGRNEQRAGLGYREDECICVVSVGGSGVGAALLRLVIDAFPTAKQKIPNLRMIVVAGPRLDPSTLRAHDGVDVHAFVPQLYKHLAACDLAIVQGGLTSTMELVACRRPFLYFPLEDHFEQTFHVDHRLRRHRAGRRMDYGLTTPEALADAMVQTLESPTNYLSVESDGAQRAAAMIAELL